jgi:hypothetical protein
VERGYQRLKKKMEHVKKFNTIFQYILSSLTCSAVLELTLGPIGLMEGGNKVSSLIPSTGLNKLIFSRPFSQKSCEISNK